MTINISLFMSTTFFKFFLLLLQTNVLFSFKVTPFCKTTCGLDNLVCKLKPCSVLNCRPPSGMLPLSKEDRIYLFNEHNRIRDEIAAGRSKQFKNVTASNMNVLTYSLELEFAAQCCANQCKNYTKICQSAPSLGYYRQFKFEFLHVGQADKELALRNMIDTLSSELQFIDFTDLGEYIPNLNKDRSAQMIWGVTTHFGCGRVRNSNVIQIICSYAPPGRVSYSPIFDIGEPCKKCACSKIYLNLCGNGFVEDGRDWTPPFVLNLAKNRVVVNSVSLILWWFIYTFLNA